MKHKTYHELISYLFWGVITTLVNYIVYFACTKIFLIHYLASNIFAWVMSVIFAFLVNKVFVFQSKNWKMHEILRQISQFVSARIFSLGLETFLLLVFVRFIGYDDSIIKIAAGVVVVIVNYIFSKWIIFKKQ